MASKTDALLDAYGRLTRALMVLHYEADTDLDYDAWVELAEVRFAEHVRGFNQVTLPEHICPEEGCIGAYVRVDGPYVFGRDHTGADVWVEKWQCQATPAHWHTREVPEP